MRVARSSFAAVIALGVSWAWAGGVYGAVAGGPQRDRQCHVGLGEPAPEFALYGADGKTYRLSDYKGKIVVLEWTDHECADVNRCHDAKLMTRLLKKYKDKPVVWLAIDSSRDAEENREQIKAWAAKKGIPYPILLDGDGEVGHAYGAQLTPQLFIVDVNGVLVYKGALDNDPHGKRASDVRPYIEWAVDAILAGANIPRSHTKAYGCDVRYAPQ